MNLERFQNRLAEELPVLYANIGWAIQYNGTEAIQGNHLWIKQSPSDNTEHRAFKASKGGIFACGIGPGTPPSGCLHVVFCARDPLDHVLKVVGLYARAKHELIEGTTWHLARTHDAILIPADRRKPVTG